MKIVRTLAAAAALIGSLALFAPAADASCVSLGRYQLSCAPSTDASTSTYGTGSTTDTYGTGSMTDTYGTGSSTDTYGTGSFGS